MASIIAITISHVAHWLSVLVMFSLTRIISGNKQAGTTALPLIASILHILSPAGLFLSAPYTEALFSLLNMFGTLLYISGMAKHRQEQLFNGNLYIALSGLVSGCATIIRSNGVLSGLPFLYDSILLGVSILRFGPDRRSVSKLCSVVIGGLMIAAGFAMPQYIAYNAYCVSNPEISQRPWCEATVPSIYTWVQSHYWYML